MRIFSSDTSVFTKVFRFFGYLLLIIGLIYQTQRLYRKLKVDPEILSNEFNIQSSEIPFPAVTICPPFVMKNEAWNQDFLSENNLTEHHLRAAMLETCLDFETYIQYTQDRCEQENKVEVNLMEVLNKASPNAADMFKVCKIGEYGMYHEECEKMFINSVTDDGICSTFNLLGYHSLFKDGISSDFDIFKREKIPKLWDPYALLDTAEYHDDLNLPEPPKWSLETGYSSQDDYIQPARALKMQTLEVQTKNFNHQKLCDEREKNYKVTLHLPNELPQITYNSIDIQLGKIKTILITAEKVQREDSLRDFPPEKRGCYFEGENPLKIFKSYTKANCEYECMIEFIHSSCGCVKFSMPRTKEMKVCEFHHASCYSIISEKWPRSYYKDRKNMAKFPHYPCGCMPSCMEIKYNIIKETEKDSSTTDLELFSMTKIVFADSQVKKVSNYVTYELENFIFDIGGLIGLFLGSSLLSFLLFLVSICRFIRDFAGNIISWLRSKNKDKDHESAHSSVPQSPSNSENSSQHIFSISNLQMPAGGILSSEDTIISVENLESYESL